MQEKEKQVYLFPSDQAVDILEPYALYWYCYCQQHWGIAVKNVLLDGEELRLPYHCPIEPLLVKKIPYSVAEL